jgi:iron complex outermembrane recepter protein
MARRSISLCRTRRARMRVSASMRCVKLVPAWLGAVAMCLHCHAAAAQQPLSAAQLKQLSLEELMDLEVTSVSRREEPLGGAAAAIAVVTNEDVRRSGATTLPDALRLVPGLHVAQQNSDFWAVSARGFSSINSEKLLVLTDSRSIYTPLYSGVFWDSQDYLLNDIDRIEVIRGPGASLWGSNAVNGVINIQTKHARDTQGAYAEAIAGTEARVIASGRYGGQFAPDGYFRVFGKYDDRDESFSPGSTSDDDWHRGQVGFRADWTSGDQDTLTLQGEFYRGNLGRLSPSIVVIGREGPVGDLRVHVDGGNVLGRWQRTLTEHSEIQLRAYYDRTHRDDPSFEDTLDTVDVDFQHHLQFAGRHDVVWGLNYRYMDNRNEGKGVFALAPQSSRDDLFSAFLQDQIALADTLQLTLGSKFEHNDFSGFEVQPSVRLAWDVTDEHMLWAAVSRAVRAPTRIERDIAVDVSNPAGNPVFRLLGNEDFESEELLAYEIGYRWQALSQLFFDLAVFYNRYEGLASLEFGTPFIDPTDGRTVLSVESQNRNDGDARGFEALVAYTPLMNWRLTASYSYVEIDIHPHGLDINRGRFLEGSTPKHQVGLRSYLDLPAGFQLDAQWRWLSDIQRLPDIVTGDGIDGYSELDLRVAWHAARGLELSIVGQNLLHRRHVEFGTPESRGAIERSVYGRFAWNF